MDNDAIFCDNGLRRQTVVLSQKPAEGLELSIGIEEAERGTVEIPMLDVEHTLREVPQPGSGQRMQGERTQFHQLL